MDGSAGSIGWGKELWHVARCVALTDSSTAAASSACSILAGIGALRRARGCSPAALLPRQATTWCAGAGQERVARGLCCGHRVCARLKGSRVLHVHARCASTGKFVPAEVTQMLHS